MGNKLKGFVKTTLNKDQTSIYEITVKDNDKTIYKYIFTSDMGHPTWAEPPIRVDGRFFEPLLRLDKNENPHVELIEYRPYQTTAYKKDKGKEK